MHRFYMLFVDCEPKHISKKTEEGTILFQNNCPNSSRQSNVVFLK